MITFAVTRLQGVSDPSVAARFILVIFCTSARDETLNITVNLYITLSLYIPRHRVYVRCRVQRSSLVKGIAVARYKMTDQIPFLHDSDVNMSYDCTCDVIELQDEANNLSIENNPRNRVLR